MDQLEPLGQVPAFAPTRGPTPPAVCWTRRARFSRVVQDLISLHNQKIERAITFFTPNNSEIFR